MTPEPAEPARRVAAGAVDYALPLALLLNAPGVLARISPQLGALIGVALSLAGGIFMLVNLLTALGRRPTYGQSLLRIRVHPRAHPERRLELPEVILRGLPLVATFLVWRLVSRELGSALVAVNVVVIIATRASLVDRLTKTQVSRSVAS